MHNLREQCRQWLQGRVCLVGVGNVELGDDGFGVRLAESIHGAASGGSEPRARAASAGACRFPAAPWEVVIAGTTPERYLKHLIATGFDHVLFLDAVDFGGAPGSVVLLDAAEMSARFPQVSTHRISLGLLATTIQSEGRARVGLLGAQPASIKPGRALSAPVEDTLALLTELLCEVGEEIPA